MEGRRVAAHCRPEAVGGDVESDYARSSVLREWRLSANLGSVTDRPVLAGSCLISELWNRVESRAVGDIASNSTRT
jgi:hypothetical protein